MTIIVAGDQAQDSSRTNLPSEGKKNQHNLRIIVNKTVNENLDSIVEAADEGTPYGRFV